MGLKFGRRCLVCGLVFDSEGGASDHIEANPTHIVVEQMFNDQSSGEYKPALAININNDTRNIAYTKVFMFNYEGTQVKGISAIDFVSHMEENNTGYSIRLVDVTNNNIICEKVDLVNTAPMLLSFENIENVPANAAILELQMKSHQNGRLCHCDSMTIK